MEHRDKPLILSTAFFILGIFGFILGIVYYLAKSEDMGWIHFVLMFVCISMGIFNIILWKKMKKMRINKEKER